MSRQGQTVRERTIIISSDTIDMMESDYIILLLERQSVFPKIGDKNPTHLATIDICIILFTVLR